eukprot:COSAG05_NODE_390_length_10436_cov_15.721196_6_plen_148_part_00
MPKKTKKDKQAAKEAKKAGKAAKKEAKISSSTYSDFDMPPEEDEEDYSAQIAAAAAKKKTPAAKPAAAKPAAAKPAAAKPSTKTSAPAPKRNVQVKEYVKASGIKPVDVSTIRKPVVRHTRASLAVPRFHWSHFAPSSVCAAQTGAP